LVRIRLLRGGAKKHPHYRVVAIDRRRKRDGRALEFLGTYDPSSNPPRVQLKHAEIDAWVAKGAQLSDGVRSLVKQARRAGAAPSGGTA
jgi:small subunit ribosomal protein S16